MRQESTIRDSGPDCAGKAESTPFGEHCTRASLGRGSPSPFGLPRPSVNDVPARLDAPSLPPLRALLGQGYTLRPTAYPSAHPFGLPLRHKVCAGVASLQANSKGSAIELRPGSGCAEIRTV